MFTTLILFWADTAKYMKNNPLGKPARVSYAIMHSHWRGPDFLTSVEAKFETTINEVDAAIRTFEHYASMRRLAPSNRTLGYDQDMAAIRGPLRNKVTFPCYDPIDHDENEFCGREDELRQIDKILSSSSDGLISQQVCSVYGMGGVGKSRLVRAYASRFKGNFDAIFLIRCENELLIRQSFSRIARQLRSGEQDQASKFEEDIELVRQWLLETSKRSMRQHSFERLQHSDKTFRFEMAPSLGQRWEIWRYKTILAFFNWLATLDY